MPVDPLDRSAGLGERGDEPVVDRIDDHAVARHLPGQALDRALGHDAPLAQHGDPVAGLLDLRQKVGVQKNRRAALRLLPQEVADLAPAHRIDAVGRLVQQEDVRLVHQRGGEAQPLRHPLGEFLDPHVGPLRQAHAVEQLRDSRFQGCGVHSRHAPEDRQRLAGGQISRKPVALGQVADAAPALRIRRGDSAQPGLARSRVGQAEQDLDGCGLAGPVGPEQAEDLAARDLQVQARQGLDPAAPETGPVDLAQPARLDREASHALFKRKKGLEVPAGSRT